MCDGSGKTDSFETCFVECDHCEGSGEEPPVTDEPKISAEELWKRLDDASMGAGSANIPKRARDLMREAVRYIRTIEAERDSLKSENEELKKALGIIAPYCDPSKLELREPDAYKLAFKCFKEVTR
jgi:hypothetical protein